MRNRERRDRSEGRASEMGPPERMDLVLSSEPPQLSEELLGRLRPDDPIVRRPILPTRAQDEGLAETKHEPIGATPPPQVPTTAVEHRSEFVLDTLLAPQTLVSFFGTSLTPQGSVVNEPSLAQAGGVVFFTGNWYAARSTDGGLSWSYANPFADMADFCCDQDVVYDRGRNLLLWYRQAVGNQTGQNRFVLSVSTDRGETWCSYSVSPTNLNSSWNTNQRFDFPHLGLSNNYLYIHTGMGGTEAPSAVVLRFPLDALAICSGFSFWWWDQVSYWGGPAQGATTTMYYGDHRGQEDSFRVYAQPEDSTSIFWADVSIPRWLLEQGDTCPSPDGQNWCSRSDSVVRAGWVSRGSVGFMWHARAGNGFPYPYLEAATFDEEDMTYIGRPYVWNGSGTWHYPFISPNARGDLGLTAYFGSSSTYPSPCFLIDDDYSPNPPPPWEAYSLSSSTIGGPAFGDYVRNRAFQPSQLGWVTSVYTLQSDQGNVSPAPSFFILGRQRDLPSIGTYWQV